MNVNGRERYNLLSSRCIKISGITPSNIFNNAENKNALEEEADRKLDEHCAIKFMETINMF